MHTVTFPLIVPGIVAGFLMSFTLSIDDFAITFFVAGDPNRAALPSIRAEVAGEPAIFTPPETLRRLEMLPDLEPKQRRLMSRLWTEIKMK